VQLMMEDKSNKILIPIFFWNFAVFL
jgi:hypothetical protein